MKRVAAVILSLGRAGRTRLLASVLLGMASVAGAETEVVFITPAGALRVELFDADKPQTVANFLAYVDSGRFNPTLVHRLVQGFVAQGGGFQVNWTDPQNPAFAAIQTDPPVPNEYDDNTVYSNVYGTLAMAKLGDDPDSATSQWFFNLADNSENLDHQNGGFTVFGRVVDGFEVLDHFNQIQEDHILYLDEPLDRLPARAVYDQARFEDLYYVQIRRAGRLLRLSGHLAFGPVSAGRSAARTMTIHNDGSDALAVTSIDYPPGFSGNWPEGTIPPGGSQRVLVSFSPSSARPYEGHITVHSDKTEGTPTLACSGDGTADPGEDARTRLDFDGDGISDTAIYHPDSGRWHISGSREGLFETQFGFAGTIPIAGDFDGDGRTDFGCYHPPTGMWYIFMSTEGFRQVQFGFDGTLPIVGDFDGDGRDDFGCYHPPTGTWYIFMSADGFQQVQFGFDGTLPVVGDFDGDGRDDFGCYHPPTGMWYIFMSTAGFHQLQFGFDGTLPIVGDFDGDGRDDFGCYHPPSGSWFVFRSSEGFWQTQFGFDGTLPVIGDFDGDGKADLGCYHPPTGAWYIFRSRDGFFTTLFGYDGTLPVGGAWPGF